MAGPDLVTVLVSAGVSAILSFGIALWKTNRARSQEREDILEDWYGQTLALCTLIGWELMRVDNEIEISSRRGNTSFTDLNIDDDDTSHELQLVDQLVFELFRHAGSAPHEIQPAYIGQQENTPVDDIRDFVSKYLQIEVDAAVLDPTVGDVVNEWCEELEDLRSICLTQLERD
ncbi:hypothetical protein [Halomarina oriensis]|uniref:DUF4760 domain-containing protein n=1 Tax=Halomarina oriensis TaxID=671145 RepID=A0A6B0GX11_9EURY|nr:hypothetical protein [Halomarina oriensis]MWG36675.1 hypothetical protein [Halomarina oriensis]